MSIQRNPSRRQLAAFAVAWMVFFGIAGGLVLRNTGSGVAAAVCWLLALVVPAGGWLSPALLRIVYLGMAYAALPLGLLISILLLAIVYYLVVTPIGLLLRVCGYDPLGRRFDREAATYWQPRQEVDDTGRYFRQF